MRILIVSNLYPPVVFGGYEILCHQVVAGLEALGHEVSVVCSTFRADEAGPEQHVYRLLQLTTAFPHPGERVGNVDFRLRTLNRIGRDNCELTDALIRSLKPDVVFAWSLNRITLGPLFAARKAGIPACHTMNDEHPKQFACSPHLDSARGLLRNAAERLVWPLATYRHLEGTDMVCISHALKRILVKKGVPCTGAKVIHQGIPLERFPFCPFERRDNDATKILYVGQLSEAKGVHTLIRAAAVLKRTQPDPFHLQIVGAGVPDYEAHLRHLVNVNGLEANVTFAGQIAHEDVPAVYRQNHILVFPSEWEEPFGLSHLEAMASGCAVVSTTTGGSAELIRHERNALAYPAGDDDALAHQLRRLMADESWRKSLLAAARDDVSERFDLRRYVANLDAHLRGIVGSGDLDARVRVA